MLPLPRLIGVAVLAAFVSGCATEPVPAEERLALLASLDRELVAWSAARTRGDAFEVAAIEDRIAALVRGRGDDLARSLAGGSASERAIAATAVAFARDTRHLAALSRLLDDPDDRVVANALLSLAILQVPLTDARRVARLLRADDPEIRAAAAAYVGQAESPASGAAILVPLVLAARDTDPRVRRNAFVALGAIKDPASQATLSGAGLADPDPLARAAAGEALAALGDPAALPDLERAFASEADEPTRRRLALAVAALRAHGLAPRPRDEHAGGDAVSEGAPIGLPGDPAPTVDPGTHRGKAAPADGELVSDAASLAALVGALVGPPAERARARSSLLRAGSEATLALAAGLASPDAERVVACADLLAERGDTRALAALDDVRRHPAELARLAAIDAIVRLAGPDGREALARGTTDPAPAVRRRAAAALIDYRDTRGIPPFLDDLGSSDETLRFRAIERLVKATGWDFGYRADAPADERARGVAEWRRWWDEHGARFEIK